MSDSSDSSSNESQNKNQKKKRRVLSPGKRFQDSWLHIPEYKGWLQKGNDLYNCRCSLCGKQFAAGTSEIKKHSVGKKHQSKLKSLQNVSSISGFIKKTVETDHENAVKRAEIKLSLYFAEHNVAFSAMDHLITLLKEIIVDSKIIKDMKLKRTKCTEIIKNVIAESETQELVNVLRETPFSIMVDESTDISDKKHMCLLTRYVHPHSGHVNTKLLELIEIDAKDGRAEQIYQHFKTCLEKFKIPLKNVIGVASDGANVMIGSNNSFFSHLKNDIPHVVLMRCICHSAAIVASKACSNLPRTAEDLTRSIYSYVSGSAKRCSILMEMQECFNNNEKQKILKLANTRWLSMHQCIERILNNWEVLTHYFRLALVEDGLKQAEYILQNLENPLVKAYFLFLKYALLYFNQFNALFQGRNILIQDLHNRSIELLRQICQNILKPQVFTQDITKLNIHNPHNLLSNEKVYVGSECEQILQTSILPKDIYDFKNNCLRFYMTAAEEIQKRFFENDVSKHLEFLKPEIAFEIDSRHKLYANLISLGQRFTNFSIDLNLLEHEWRSLAVSLTQSQKSFFKTLNIDEMWFEISNLKNFEDKVQFPNVAKLAKLMLSLPHSNAESERIFSMISDIKNKKRNKIGHGALNAVCIIRSALSAKKSDCANYCVTTSHLKLHNCTMYSFKSF